MTTELQRAERARNRLWNKQRGGEAVPVEQMKAAHDRVNAAKNAEHTALLASIPGRTIVSIEETDHSGDSEWTEHLSYALTLDDGRVITFSGWGYDAWGCDVGVQ